MRKPRLIPRGGGAAAQSDGAAVSATPRMLALAGNELTRALRHSAAAQAVANRRATSELAPRLDVELLIFDISPT